MASHNRVKVAVLGASGYSGIEAVRILAGHPFVELSALTSEHYAGREVAEVYRHLAGVDLPPFEELRPDLLKGRVDIVISCLPERVGAPLLADLISQRHQSDRSFGGFSAEGPRRLQDRLTAPIIPRQRCSRRLFTG